MVQLPVIKGLPQLEAQPRDPHEQPLPAIISGVVNFLNGIPCGGFKGDSSKHVCKCVHMHIRLFNVVKSLIPSIPNFVTIKKIIYFAKHYSDKEMHVKINNCKTQKNFQRKSKMKGILLFCFSSREQRYEWN